jgi:hypothetical protein|tara:strand:- start:271 stop:552 length:282 start_codon:yes stop_codon:yes gene_type:complete
MQNLAFLVLVEGEFRSLIRNTFERLIDNRFDKQDDPMKEILKKLSIRAVSSLLAIQIYSYIQRTSPELRIYVSYAMVIAFIYFIMKQNKEKYY